VTFNGEEKDEWPEFATELLAMGSAEGGWDKALEMQLDLEVAANKKLNKLAWCYLTLMLQGEALDEMDMIPDKNAYDVWLCLNRKYKPRNEKAIEEVEIKSEKERKACIVCDQKRQINQGEEQCFERQEEKGYCYLDLWNQDIKEGEEEIENKNMKMMNLQSVTDKRNIMECKRKVVTATWTCMKMMKWKKLNWKMKIERKKTSP